jgi:hypothetical protein
MRKEGEKKIPEWFSVRISTAGVVTSPSMVRTGYEYTGVFKPVHYPQNATVVVLLRVNAWDTVDE